MTRRRPAVAITADLSIWVGNTSDVDFSCEPGELIGFGTGGFEEKIIGGDLLSVCFFGNLLECFGVFTFELVVNFRRPLR